MKITDLPADCLADVMHLVEEIRDVELPTPCGWRVLVLQYVRPEKSAGGIIMAEQTKREDIYQGRCGIVLAVGPMAYKDTEKFGPEPWCKPGDWILWPPVEAAAARFAYGKGITLAMLQDDSVLAVNIDPVRTVTNG